MNRAEKKVSDDLERFGLTVDFEKFPATDGRFDKVYLGGMPWEGITTKRKAELLIQYLFCFNGYGTKRGLT